MVTYAEDNPFPYITLVDTADPTTPAAGTKRLWVDTDDTLKIINESDVVTNVGGAPSSLILPTSAAASEGAVEYDTAAERVNVYDGQRERTIGHVGWATAAYPHAYDPGAAFATAISLPANGGSIAVPMIVPAHMLFAQVVLRNTDTGTARTWFWDLYVNDLNNGNAGENTVRRVATATAVETFTPGGAASTRFLAPASTPVYLAPGVYWLVIQNQHATNTFGVGSTAPNSASPSAAIVGAITKTTTNPNGATLDLVAATWTPTQSCIGVGMRGRVLGMTTVY